MDGSEGVHNESDEEINWKVISSGTVEIDKKEISATEQTEPQTADTVPASNLCNDSSILCLRCGEWCSTDRIRQQLRRSKMKVEGHLCYPWLRRLVFHLSHYFPNLHTTRSAHTRRTNNRKARRNTDLINQGDVGSPHGARSFELGDSSPDSLFPIQHLSTGQSPVRYGSNCDMNHRHDSINLNDDVLPNKYCDNRPNRRNRTRRPLQRQKSNMLNDFEHEFESMEHPKAFARIRTNHSWNHGAVEKSDLPFSSSKVSNPIRRHENRSKLEMSRIPRGESSGTDSSLGVESLPRDCCFTEEVPEAGPSTERSGPRKIKPRHQSPLPIASKKKTQSRGIESSRSSTNRSSENRQENILNKSDFVHLPREAHPNDTFHGMAHLHGDYLPRSPRKQRGDAKACVQQLSSDGKSNIQYRRVKARRNSSISQLDHCPNSTCLRTRSFREEQPTNEFAILHHGPFACEPCPTELQGSVNKLVENWLEEAMHVTEQRKARRRANMFQFSGCDSTIDYPHMPESATAQQPHSFDVPGALDKDRHLNSCPKQHYSFEGRHISRLQKNNTNTSSYRSSESQGLIVPSLTIDSDELGCSPPPVMTKDCTIEQNHIEGGGVGGTERNIFSLVDNRDKYNYLIKQRANLIAKRKYEVPVSNSFELPTNLPNAVHRSSFMSQRDGGVPQTISLLPAPVCRERASSFHGPEQTDVGVNNAHSCNRNISLTGGDDSAHLLRMAFISQSHSYTHMNHESRSPMSRSRAHVFQQQLIDRNGSPRIMPHLTSLQTTPKYAEVMYSSHSSGGSAKKPHGHLLSTGQNSEESEIGPVKHLLQHPNPSAMFERRYSHHLKPLDAWQSRQSHSMEVVNTTRLDNRSNNRGTPTARTATRRHMPVVYTRSMQQSTSSFPSRWLGFASGPELSLNSPADSNSLTPDSLKYRAFFARSAEAEIRQCRSNHAFPPNTHATSESLKQQPQLHILEPNAYSVIDGKNRYSRTTLIPSPHAFDGNIERKVRSFELNLQLEQNNELRRQAHLQLPNHHSSGSSRRGSSVSNQSAGVDINQEIAMVQTNRYQPISTVPERKASFAVNMSKLIPPDLIFSPASRRASIMDEDQSETPDPQMPEMIINSEPAFGGNSMRYTSKFGHSPRVTTSSQDVRMTQYANNNFISSEEIYNNQCKDHPTATTLATNHNWWSRHFCRSADSQPMPWSENINHTMNDINQCVSHPHSQSTIVHALIPTPPTVQYSPVGSSRSHTDLRPSPNYKHCDFNTPMAMQNNHRVQRINSVNMQQHHSPKTSRVICEPGLSKKDAITRNCRDTFRDSCGHKEPISDPTVRMAKLSFECPRENYLFRSTSTGDSGIDKKLLQPSLRPVVDSSEENLTDNEYEEHIHGDSSRRDVGTRHVTERGLDQVTSKHQQARRRSFLASNWHQTIQQSCDTEFENV